MTYDVVTVLGRLYKPNSVEDDTFTIFLFKTYSIYQLKMSEFTADITRKEPSTSEF